eukprot:gene16894-20088_t
MASEMPQPPPPPPPMLKAPATYPLCRKATTTITSSPSFTIISAKDQLLGFNRSSLIKTKTKVRTADGRVYEEQIMSHGGLMCEYIGLDETHQIKKFDKTRTPTIVCLQEVTPMFLDLLATQAWVKDNYLISDCGQSDTVFPYGVVILTLRSALMLRSMTFYPLPSSQGRRMLTARFELNSGALMSVSTVHLESLNRNCDARIKQLQVISGLMQEFSSTDSASFLVGDFNFGAKSIENGEAVLGRYTDVWDLIQGADDQGITCIKKNERMIKIQSIEFTPKEYQKRCKITINKNIINIKKANLIIISIVIGRRALIPRIVIRSALTPSIAIGRSALIPRIVISSSLTPSIAIGRSALIPRIVIRSALTPSIVICRSALIPSVIAQRLTVLVTIGKTILVCELFLWRLIWIVYLSFPIKVGLFWFDFAITDWFDKILVFTLAKIIQHTFRTKTKGNIA